LLAGIAGSLLSWFSPPAYTSTVRLFVTVPGTEVQIEHIAGQDHSPDLLWAYYTTTSTEMADHLIRTFDLYSHYGIPPAAPNKRAVAIAQLLARIEPRYLDHQSMTVSVQDADRDLAVALANEVFKQLEAMAQRRATDGLQRSIAVYERVVERAEVRAEKRMELLAAMVANYMEQQRAFRSPGGPNRTDMAVDPDLQRSIASFTAMDDPMSQLRQTLDMASELHASADFPRVALVQEAMPDLRTSPMRDAIGIGAITSLLVLGMLLVAVALWHQHGHEVHAYFTS